MKIGANEPCPCGSGKKYKRCCRNNDVDVRTLWNTSINTIAGEMKLDYRITKIIISTLDFLYQAKWKGACHGISAILFVIFRELGFNVKLCTGIICREVLMSGHSWIEVDDKVYDVACYFPVEGCPKLMPVFNGMELDTMKPSQTVYGISAPLSLAADVQMVLDDNTTVPKVLNGEYENLNDASLWNVLDNICLLAEINGILNVTNDHFDTSNLAEKYKDARWVLCDQIPIPVN